MTATADAFRIYREEVTAADRRRAHATRMLTAEYKRRLAGIGATYDQERLAASQRYSEHLTAASGDLARPGRDLAALKRRASTAVADVLAARSCSSAAPRPRSLKRRASTAVTLSATGTGHKSAEGTGTAGVPLGGRPDLLAEIDEYESADVPEWTL